MIPKCITIRDVGTLMRQDKNTRSILQDSTNQISWAQFGEDLLVIDLLRNTVAVALPGFYVDVGAYHPIDLSNTFALSCQGWRGINIDAVEDSITAFQAIRKRDISLRYAVRNYDGDTEFFLGKNSSGESSLSADWGSGHQKSIQIPCRTLNTILEEHLPPETQIDFMSIDVEGAENEIFEGFNIEQYKPTILALEIKLSTIEELLDHPLYIRLKNAGYILKALCGPTYIFVDSAKLVQRTMQEQYELSMQFPKY